MPFEILTGAVIGAALASRKVRQVIKNVYDNTIGPIVADANKYRESKEVEPVKVDEVVKKPFIQG